MLRKMVDCKGVTVVLVTGSRELADASLVKETLDKVPRNGRIVLVHGGCRGADELAGAYAEAAGWDVKVYRANWKRHKLRAGPLRNMLMVTESRPHMAFAFLSPTSKGTKHCLSVLRKYADEPGSRLRYILTVGIP